MLFGSLFFYLSIVQALCCETLLQIYLASLSYPLLCAYCLEVFVCFESSTISTVTFTSLYMFGEGVVMHSPVSATYKLAVDIMYLLLHIVFTIRFCAVLSFLTCIVQV